jgi:hypothetical protein
VISTSWLANSFRTQNVDPSILQSNESVSIIDDEETLNFQPKLSKSTGLIFMCGAGVAAQAYAPLLRPIADSGYPVFIVKLPFRIALLESHKLAALDRAQHVIAEHTDISHWVLSGHSLGGALVCRLASQSIPSVSALIVIGTTHPNRDDLSSLRIPVTKVYGSNDGVAPIGKIQKNRHLLPIHTKWILIQGGNHSQFGHYGHQLFDGTASISRNEQQQVTRTAIFELFDTQRIGELNNRF